MNGRALYPIFYHLLRAIRKPTYIKRCGVKSSTIYKEQIIKRAKKKKTNSSCSKNVYYFP
jgi:hypothetical protein